MKSRYGDQHRRAIEEAQRSLSAELANVSIHNHTGHVLTERGLRLAQSAVLQLHDGKHASDTCTLEGMRGGKVFTFQARATSAGLLTI